MIWIGLHILPEYLCLPAPLDRGTVFIRPYRTFELVLAQKEDWHFISYQQYPFL